MPIVITDAERAPIDRCWGGSAGGGCGGSVALPPSASEIADIEAETLPPTWLAPAITEMAIPAATSEYSIDVAARSHRENILNLLAKPNNVCTLPVFVDPPS